MELPANLELPLASGASWWYWLGGRPAIDFVNTHRERWWRNVETLVTVDDLSLWLQQADLLHETTTPTAGHLRGARRLRYAINSGVQACVDRSPTPERAIVEINRWLADACVTRRLQAQSHGLWALTDEPPSDPIRHGLARVALDAATMLGTDQRDRVRICASETCSARFYDASRPGTRRWCSMSSCGNNAKARRHRARQSTGR